MLSSAFPLLHTVIVVFLCSCYACCYEKVKRNCIFQLSTHAYIIYVLYAHKCIHCICLSFKSISLHFICLGSVSFALRSECYHNADHIQLIADTYGGLMPQYTVDSWYLIIWITSIIHFLQKQIYTCPTGKQLNTTKT